MINNPIISSEFRTINKSKLPWTPQELKYPGEKIVNKHINTLNTLKAIKFNINKTHLIITKMNASKTFEHQENINTVNQF